VNVVEDLAIRHGGNCGAKRGSTRVFIAANLGFAAAVIGVAELAFLPEQIAARCDVGGIGFERVLAGPQSLGNTLVQEPCRDRHLDPWWLAAHAGEPRQNEPVKRRGGGYDDKKDRTSDDAALGGEHPGSSLTARALSPVDAPNGFARRCPRCFKTVLSGLTRIFHPNLVRRGVGN
jgi:hypothetical protein